MVPIIPTQVACALGACRRQHSTSVCRDGCLQGYRVENKSLRAFVVIDVAFDNAYMCVATMKMK